MGEPHLTRDERGAKAKELIEASKRLMDAAQEAVRRANAQDTTVAKRDGGTPPEPSSSEASVSVLRLLQEGSGPTCAPCLLARTSLGMYEGWKAVRQLVLSGLARGDQRECSICHERVTVLHL